MVTPHPDPALCAALAADLNAAGFTAGALRAAWGEQADTALARGMRDPALRVLADRDDALAVLARLLALGASQPVAAVDAALPATGAAGLRALGLARIDAALVAPAALVRPQAFSDAGGDGEWWIASDLDESVLGAALPEDHVLGWAAPRRPSRVCRCPITPRPASTSAPDAASRRCGCVAPCRG